MSTLHWADIGEKTFTFGIRFLVGVHRLLGRWPFRVCLIPVVLFYWLGSATARRSSREYLQRLQASQQVFAREPGAWTSLRHFLRFGETLLDKILAIGGRYDIERVRFDGEAALLDAIAKGDGGVIVTAHVGCVELLQAMAERRPGLRVNILVHTAHAQRFNRILAGLNPAAQVQLLQVTAFDAPTAMRLAERVAAGEWIAIAGDRVPLSGDRVLRLSFLGHPAAFPAGPYLLASALRCPLYAMACLHAGDGYRIRVEQLAERVELPRARREAAMSDHATHFVRWIEQCLHDAPLDWFNFYPFWEPSNDDARLAT